MGYTSKEVSKKLGVSLQTVRRYKEKGYIKVKEKKGTRQGGYIYEKESVENLIRKGVER